MRSLLLIFGTIVLAALGFFAYLWFQPTANPNAGSSTAVEAIAPASRPTETPDPDRIGGSGPSEKIWVKSYDEHTGQLSNEFRSDRFEPRKDGTVDVTQPDAKFYMGAKSGADGQVMVVHGKTGKVVVPDSANTRTQMKASGTVMPSRGQLQDVTLYLYDNAEATEPTLTCTMENASFDRETFRIQTESYEQDGKIIPADQVPVIVRGRDYDFDGRGLDIRWNERDRRLQELEIAHGEKLVVKHPQAIKGFGGPGEAGAGTGATSFAKPQALVEMLASTDSAAAGDAIKTTTPPAAGGKAKKRAPVVAPPPVAPVKIVRDKSAPIFRATFMDNVKIVQVDQTLATANQMHVDFVMESQADSTTQPATEPSGATPSASSNSDKAAMAQTKAPTTAPAQAAKSKPTASAEKKRAKRTETAGNAPATAPTSQPTEQPVTILWTGKLHVAPLDAETQAPPTKEDSVITLEGEPVVLTRGQGRAECSMVRYRTLDSSVHMESSVAVPNVVMSDADGSTVHTPSLDYDGTEGVVVMRGAGDAHVIMKNQATTQPAVAETATTAPATQPVVMNTSWTRTCRLFLTGQSKENMTIDKAALEGDVNVDHPQVKGRSDSLELTFVQMPTTRPAAAGSSGPSNETQLKTMDAEGKVHYVIINEGKNETLACSHLTLETAKDQNNKMYAHSMNADGEVHAFDDQQDLKCGQLALQFLPTTKPSTQPADPTKIDTSSIVVETMSAQQDVRMTTADGNAAKADSLSMVTEDGKRTVTLVGEPNAMVRQKDDVLLGPVITFYPDTNRASVTGAGTMHAVQQPAPDAKDKKPQPIDIGWGGNLSANGDLNLVDITQQIKISARTSDGAMNNATSDRLKLTMMDDPKAATQSTTQKVKKTKGASSSDAMASFGNSDFFKNKVVKTVFLYDNVQLTSLLNDEKGKLLRRMLLKSPVVQYDMQEKTFLVPAAGEMLLEDESKSSPSMAALTDSNPGSDMHGPTAFKWSKELRYDDNQHRMTMSGDVDIEHLSSGDSKPFTLKAQKITADMEPVPTTQPTSGPAATTKPGDSSPAQEKMRLKHVNASDQVEFTSAPIHFFCTAVDYDPDAHILTAHGNDRVRAQLYDDKGSVDGSFMQLRYDTQTGRIIDTTDFRGTVRR